MPALPTSLIDLGDCTPALDMPTFSGLCCCVIAKKLVTCCDGCFVSTLHCFFHGFQEAATPTHEVNTLFHMSKNLIICLARTLSPVCSYGHLQSDGRNQKSPLLQLSVSVDRKSFDSNESETTFTEHIFRLLRRHKQFLQIWWITVTTNVNSK